MLFISAAFAVFAVKGGLLLLSNWMPLEITASRWIVILDVAIVGLIYFAAARREG